MYRHSFFVIALGLSACATSYPLRASDQSPAATGVVKAKHDDHGNTKLALKVDHLPRPMDLKPGLSTYVVWSVADGGARVRNLGQLEVGEDRKGEVKVVSPLPNFELLVTAEPNGQVAQPSDNVVLRGNVTAPAQ